MPDRTDEILSAVSMLSERIGKLEGKVDQLTVACGQIDTNVTKIAKKLLAPEEQRDLGIDRPSSGVTRPPETYARAAKGR